MKCDFSELKRSPMHLHFKINFHFEYLNNFFSDDLFSEYDQRKNVNR